MLEILCDCDIVPKGTELTVLLFQLKNLKDGKVNNPFPCPFYTEPESGESVALCKRAFSSNGPLMAHFKSKHARALELLDDLIVVTEKLIESYTPKDDWKMKAPAWDDD